MPFVALSVLKECTNDIFPQFTEDNILAGIPAGLIQILQLVDFLLDFKSARFLFLQARG